MKPEDDIKKLISQVAFGSLNFEVKRYDNKTVGLVGGLTHSFKPDDNVKAYEYILKQLKQAQDGKYKGTLTFSVVYNEGDVKRVIKQDYDSKSYKGDE